MAESKYTVESQEGVAFIGADEEGDYVEIGSEVLLDLTKDQETALVAAGWLSAGKSKGGKD